MYLAGLGVTFSDLPKGGVNLRLYTGDLPGPNCQTPGVPICYNTGHYDISLPGGPCSQPDPQAFHDWPSMDAYAGAHSEFLVLVTRADLPSLCSARAPVTAPSFVPSMPAVPAAPTAPLTESGGTFQVPIKQPTSAAPAPVIVATPSGPVFLPPPGQAVPGPTEGFPVPTQWLVIGGIFAALFLSRR